MSRAERIWMDQHKFRHEWIGDPYELLALEEFYLIVEAVCAQYEALHSTKLVVRLLPDGCNLSCWPDAYDLDRLRVAIGAAIESGFDNTDYLPSQPAIAERLWGIDGYFVATV